MTGITRIYALTKRNVKEILREPINLVFLYGLPAAMLVLFYLLFHSATSQFEMKYLAPAMICFGQSFISLFAGILVSTDRASSFMGRLYATRTTSAEFILGYTLAMIPTALSQTFIFLLTAVIIDPSVLSPYLALALVFGIFTALFFIGAGLLFGSLCNEKSVGGVTTVVTIGQSVLSGMWFPTEGLSGTFLKIMDVLPFKNGSLLMQNVAAGSFSFDGVWRPLIVITAYAVVAFFAAVLVFRKKMTR